MSFRDCLLSAVSQGALDAAEAEKLAATHEAEVKAALARGALDPLAEAKAAVEKIVDEDAKEALRRKALQAARMEALAVHAVAHRSPAGKPDIAAAFEGSIENANNLLFGAPSVVGRATAHIMMAHAKMEKMLYETRRRFVSGRRHGQAVLDNIAREAFGQGTGDEAAKGFLAAWRGAVDELVDAFNAAGGRIAKRENYFPQAHDPRAVLRAGRDTWMADIKPGLDVSAMRDPLTGGALTPARLDEALDVIWGRIVTDGAVDAAPSTRPQGRGALATQRAEERFLEFKDGEAWLAYHKAYGGDDVHAVMMNHVHSLARDVAALEVLGPDPDATVAWMQSVIRQEAGRHWAGKSSLFRRGLTDLPFTRADDFLGRMWEVVRGPGHSPNKAADAIKGLRNYLTGTLLGQTALTALASDPAQATWARRFAGIPAFRAVADLPRQLLSGASQREISRAGVVIADAMEHLRTDAGGYGLAAASKEWSRWLPDRVFTWTGLTPVTNAQRRSTAQHFMFHAGDLADLTLAQMQAKGGQDARFARLLAGFGIDEAHWDAIRAAKGLDHGEAGRMLRPVDVAGSGHPLAREATLRYAEAMQAAMEEATPGGTLRARTILGAHTKEGTVVGELTRSVTMFLTYPSTVLMSVMNAVAHESAGGAARGIGYAAQIMFTLSLGGAAIMVMQALRNGRDAPKIDDAKFWAEALAKGGGFGFYGDWLLADYGRGSADQAARMAGPVAGFLFDALAVASPAAALSEDDKTNRKERAVRFARRNAPILSAWPVKAVADRAIFDRLQLAANPDAYKAWRRVERRFEKEKDQGTWWRRGEIAPHRAPDLSLW